MRVYVCKGNYEYPLKRVRPRWVRTYASLQNSSVCESPWIKKLKYNSWCSRCVEHFASCMTTVDLHNVWTYIYRQPNQNRELSNNKGKWWQAEKCRPFRLPVLNSTHFKSHCFQTIDWWILFHTCGLQFTSSKAYYWNCISPPQIVLFM